MRLPSFRVRTLMLTVGVVGMLIWGGMIGTRTYVYFRLAREYGAYERGWRYMAARDRANPCTRARTVSAVWGVQTADYYAPVGPEISPGDVAPLDTRRTRSSRAHVWRAPRLGRDPDNSSGAVREFHCLVRTRKLARAFSRSGFHL